MARTGDNAVVPALGVYGQNSAPTISSDLTGMADDVAQVLSGEVADLASLPSTGNWVNRMIWVDSVGEPRWWNGTGWVRALSSTDWASIPLASGYAVGDFGFAPQWRVEGFCIRLRGVMKKSSGNIGTGETLFTLPLGGRPGMVSYYTWRGSGTATVNAQISAAGVAQGSASGTTNWLSLDGTTFDR